MLNFIMGKKERIKRQKRLKAEKLKIQKRKQQNIVYDEIVAEATQQLKTNLNPDYKIRSTPGPIKYSEVLTDFVSPLLEIYGKGGKDIESIKHIYRLGILAWNLVGLKRAKDQKKYLEEINEMHDKLEEVDIARIQMLMTRKEDVFSEFKVIYVSFEIVDKNGDIGISTAVVDVNHPH